MGEGEIIRKCVGRIPNGLTVFERLRRLNAFVRKLNCRKSNDGEHVRRPYWCQVDRYPETQAVPVKGMVEKTIVLIGAVL
jgi:hypothetical protein